MSGRTGQGQNLLKLHLELTVSFSSEGLETKKFLECLFSLSPPLSHLLFLQRSCIFHGKTPLLADKLYLENENTKGGDLINRN